MPTVLIDADGCPVVDLTIRICRACSVPVLILCDTVHRIERDLGKGDIAPPGQVVEDGSHTYLLAGW